MWEGTSSVLSQKEVCVGDVILKPVCPAHVLGVRKIGEQLTVQYVSFHLILLSVRYFTDIFSGSISSESKVVFFLRVELLYIFGRCFNQYPFFESHASWWSFSWHFAGSAGWICLPLLGKFFQMVLSFKFLYSAKLPPYIFQHICPWVPSAASLHVPFVLIVLKSFIHLLSFLVGSGAER